MLALIKKGLWKMYSFVPFRRAIERFLANGGYKGPALANAEKASWVKSVGDFLVNNPGKAFTIAGVLAALDSDKLSQMLEEYIETPAETELLSKLMLARGASANKEALRVEAQDTSPYAEAKATLELYSKATRITGMDSEELIFLSGFFQAIEPEKDRAILALRSGRNGF